MNKLEKLAFHQMTKKQRADEYERELLRKEKEKTEYLETKARVINEVHRFINDMAPVLQQFLLDGYKLKADGTLYAKDHTRYLDTKAGVIAKHPICKKWLNNDRLEFQGNSVCYEVSFRYPALGGNSVEYNKQFVYLIDYGKTMELRTFRTDYSAALFQATEKSMEKIKEEIRRLETELSQKRNILEASY